VPRTSLLSRATFVDAEERSQLRTRVGRFVRKRRTDLGLKLGDVSGALGYRSKNAVSNVESGIEGIPAKRAYAWADILEVPRDAFFQFVTGDIDDIKRAATSAESGRLTEAERELLGRYRRLPRRFQALLRERAVELETLATAPRRRAR
jgi:transcriptional regulator with XRE-family HTH domain